MTRASVKGALAAARGVGVERLDASLLLAFVLDATRESLIADDARELDEAQERRWQALLGRRAAGEPLAYLVGEKEFYGLRLVVDRSVLVPRPETELLVEWLVELVGPDPRRPCAVLDLGTGSGAVALAIAQRLPQAKVTATDASPAALAVARENGERLGLDVRWLAGDWWHGLPNERFDAVVANPPYLAAGDPHLVDLRFEPADALVAGPRGLESIERIVAGAAPHLAAGAWLLVEHGHEQGAAVRALFGDAGLEAVETRRDLAGHERATGGLSAGAPAPADVAAR